MSLEDINGIGKKTVLYLNHLGIYNIDDLVSYYPYRYDIIKRSNLDTIKDMTPAFLNRFDIIELENQIIYCNKEEIYNLITIL